MRRALTLSVMVTPVFLGIAACSDPETSDGATTTADPQASGTEPSEAGTSTSAPNPLATPSGVPSGPPGNSTGAPPSPTIPPENPSQSGPSATPTTPASMNDGGAAGLGSNADGGTPGVPSNGGNAGESGIAGSPIVGGMGGIGGSTGVAGGGTTGGAGNPGVAGAGGAAPDRPSRVLLYTFSTLDIPSVPAQLDVLGQWLGEWGFEVDESEDPAVFTDANLENYAAVGMINTCFSPFGENQSGDGPQAVALQAFVQAGGGLFGTHCASVTFQNANPVPLYNELLGGRASSQNFEGSNSCTKVAEHATVSALPDTFEYVGNLDATNFIADDTTVLVQCDFGNGSVTNVPVSWVRTEGLGRVFFSNFAKVDIDLMDPVIGDSHLKPALAWVLWQ